MGSRFLAVALIASTAWYALHGHSGKISVWSAFLRVMLWSFLAAGAGKAVGIVGFRLRARKSRIKQITLIS